MSYRGQKKGRGGRTVNKPLGFAWLLIIILLALSCAPPASKGENPAVNIGNQDWEISLATTPQELSQGLGGLPSLPQGRGMLFDLGEEKIIAVTTEPMLFTIDVVFISKSLRVTEVASEVIPGRFIMSQGPARYFLEVNAGEAAKVKAGDLVKLRLPTSKEGR